MSSAPDFVEGSKARLRRIPALHHSRSSQLGWIAWITVAASVSPLPASVFGIGGNSIFLLGCFAFFVCHFARGGRYPLSLTPIALVPILFTVPAIIYWRDPPLALFPIYLVAALLVLIALDETTLRKFSSAASWSLLVVSIGAWIGFTYAFFGGASLYTIQNPDGRANDWFLTTFSNWSIGNLIRPAGLFDEPGTLSFLICLTAALRNRLNQSKKMTWILLAVGLITTSLAHIIYMICHAVADRRLFGNRKKYLVAAVVAGITIFTNLEAPDSVESEVFLSRFVVEDGKFGGDSRSNLLLSAMNRIDGTAFFFGLDSDCVVRAKECEAKGYGQFGETPAGMILLLGIFLAAPYFFVLVASIVLAFKNREPVLLGVFLLLLQRPYVSTYGYSLIIVIAIFAPDHPPHRRRRRWVETPVSAGPKPIPS